MVDLVIDVFRLLRCSARIVPVVDLRIGAW